MFIVMKMMTFRFLYIILLDRSIICFIFSKFDALVKNKLIKLFVLAFMVLYFGTWEVVLLNVLIIFGGNRKGLERVWSLPLDTTCDLLYVLSDSIPTYNIAVSLVLYIRACIVALIWLVLLFDTVISTAVCYLLLVAIPFVFSSL